VWVPLQGRHVCTLEGGVGEGVRPCNSKELKGEGRRAKGEGRRAKGEWRRAAGVWLYVAVCGDVWLCVVGCGNVMVCDGMWRCGGV